MNPSRKQRIAQGAGVDISEVNRLVKQFGPDEEDDETASGHGRWRQNARVLADSAAYAWQDEAAVLNKC